MLTFSCRWLGRRGSLERWLSDKGQPCLVTVSHTPETLPAAPCHSGTALWPQVLLLRTWGYGTEVTPVQPLRIMLCPSNSLVFCPSELDKHFLCFLFHLQLTIIYKSVIHILFLVTLSTGAFSWVFSWGQAVPPARSKSLILFTQESGF